MTDLTQTDSAAFEAHLRGETLVEIPLTVVRGITMRSDWKLQPDASDPEALEDCIDITTDTGKLDAMELLAIYSDRRAELVTDGVNGWHMSLEEPAIHVFRQTLHAAIEAAWWASVKDWKERDDSSLLTKNTTVT